jgi:hypothetical protein
MATLTPAIIRLITAPEALGRGVEDSVSRVLVEWLESECLQLPETTETEVLGRIRELQLHARGVLRFCQLWNDPATRAGAVQLWATERWGFRLPTGPATLWELLERATSCRPCRSKMKVA